MKLSKLILISIIVFPFLHFAAQGTSQLFPIIKNLLRLFLVLVILYNYKYILQTVIKKYSSFMFFIIYLVLSYLSLLYTSDFMYSFTKVLDLTIIFFISIVIINKYIYDEEELIKYILYIILVYIGTMYIVGLSIYPHLYRSMGFEGTVRLGGYLVNPNLLGYTALIGIILLLFMSFNTIKIFTQNNLLDKIYLYIIISFLIFVLLETVSRSALGIGLFSIFISLYIFSNSQILKFISILFMFILILLVVFNFELILDYYSRGSLEQILTLTGRIPIWSEIISSHNFEFKSFLGNGFQMLSEDGLGMKLKAFDNHELTMAHNNFIQVYLGLGLIGLILSVFIFLSYFNNIRYCNTNYKNLFSIIGLIILVFSTVEFGIFGPNNIVIFLFLLITYYINKKGLA